LAQCIMVIAITLDIHPDPDTNDFL